MLPLICSVSVHDSFIVLVIPLFFPPFFASSRSFTLPIMDEPTCVPPNPPEGYEFDGWLFYTEVWEDFPTYPVKSTSQASSKKEIDNVGDPQLASLFFSRLPLEIRRKIYDYYWDGPHPRAQHILSDNNRKEFASSACIINPDEIDPCWDELGRDYPAIKAQGYALEAKWVTRLRSDWHNHWRCQEEALSNTVSMKDNSNASILSVCKRM